MANSKKAQALSREIGDKLKKRLSALTFVQSFDTDSNPVWTIGPDTTTTQSAIIKIKPTDWTLAKDALGNAANMYANHTVQLVTEKSVIGTGAGDYLTLPTLLALLGEILSLGCKVEWYQDTNGTAPTLADITAAKLIASYDSLYNPLISSQ